jgi:protein-tyrosine-phosphatase
MAEALLKMSAKRGVQICSAGIKAGTEINKQALKGRARSRLRVEPHKCRHISHFLNVTFNYVATMHVPDLGDMVIANWIVDWDKPDPAQGGIAEYRRVRERIGDEICTELPANRGTGSEN